MYIVSTKNGLGPEVFLNKLSKLLNAFYDR